MSAFNAGQRHCVKPDTAYNYGSFAAPTLVFPFGVHEFCRTAGRCGPVLIVSDILMAPAGRLYAGRMCDLQKTNYQFEKRKKDLAKKKKKEEKRQRKMEKTKGDLEEQPEGSPETVPEDSETV